MPLLYSDPIKSFAVICAGLSCVSSLSIILTSCIFHSMRRKIFMRIITIISVCDFIGCLSLTFGYPSAGSLLCSIQGAVAICFLRASILWTLCLCWQLYCLVLYNKLLLYEHQMHAICWSITVMLELLPLSTNSYGSDDEVNEELMCYIKGPSYYASLWICICFTTPLVVCIFFMICCCVRLSSYYSTSSSNSSNTPTDRIKSVVSVLKYYPIIMIVCWLPNAVLCSTANLLVTNYSPFTLDSINVTIGIGSLYGFFLTILFFSNSKEARERWYYLIFRYHGHHDTVFIDHQELESHEDSFRQNEKIALNNIHDQLIRTFSVSSIRSDSTSTKDLEEALFSKVDFGVKDFRSSQS